MIMVFWTWSLLQFTVALTTFKQLPEVDNNTEAIAAANVDRFPGKDNAALTDDGEASSSSADNKIAEAGNCNIEAIAAAKVDRFPGKDNATLTDDGEASSSSADYKIEKTESDDVNVESPPTPIKMSPEKVRKRDIFDAYMERKRLFECFCFYNEIWGMVMRIIFQDGPFLIARLVIFRYVGFSQTIYFWTAKNAFVIVLLLYRVRMICKQQKKPWQERMNQVDKQRRSNA